MWLISFSIVFFSTIFNCYFSFLSSHTFLPLSHKTFFLPQFSILQIKLVAGDLFDDASMWSYNDAAQECVCKQAVPNANATLAFIISTAFTSGKSSVCTRTEYTTCRAAYQAGSVKSGSYYINERDTFCDMEIHGGGWELVANAGGTGNWPNFGDSNFKTDVSTIGLYDDMWDFSTASSRFAAPEANYKRSYAHLLDDGVVNNNVEMLFMTFDRSYWCVLRHVDVTQRHDELTELNAQVLGSSQSSATYAGGWTNIRNNLDQIKDPIVQCEGLGSVPSTNPNAKTLWMAMGNAIDIDFKNAHGGVGVFVRNGDPNRCRPSSGGGVTKKTFHQTSNQGTVGRHGGGTSWPSGALEILSASSSTPSCYNGGEVSNIVDGSFNTRWSICPISSASAVGSAQNVAQEEVEVDISIAWGDQAPNFFGKKYLNEGNDQIRYDGESSPCIHQVDVVWSENSSAAVYNVLASYDGVNFHRLHQSNVNGCRTNSFGIDGAKGMCVDHIDISAHPFRARYVRLQLLSHDNERQDWNQQQGIDTMRYELNEIRILGAVCVHDFQGGATTSIATFDLGGASQQTADYPVGAGTNDGDGYGPVYSISTDGESGELGSSSLTSNTFRDLSRAMISDSLNITIDSTLVHSNMINSTQTGGVVLYGNDLDFILTDGVYTESGDLRVKISGLTQGHHLIETVHHDPSSVRSAFTFDVSMNSEGSTSLSTKSQFTSGTGNMTGKHIFDIFFLYFFSIYFCSFP